MKYELQNGNAYRRTVLNYLSSTRKSDPRIYPADRPSTPFVRVIRHPGPCNTHTSLLSRMPCVIPAGITPFKLVDRTLSSPRKTKIPVESQNYNVQIPAESQTLLCGGQAPISTTK